MIKGLTVLAGLPSSGIGSCSQGWPSTFQKNLITVLLFEEIDMLGGRNKRPAAIFDVIVAHVKQG